VHVTAAPQPENCVSEHDQSVQIPAYYQLKAELDVSFRRYVKEMADDIVRRIDRSETERREERRELEQRIRDLELHQRELAKSLPSDLTEQLRKLHEQGASTRATGKLLVTIFGFALSIVGIGIAVITIFA
jgi:hypothetical protein